MKIRTITCFFDSALHPMQDIAPALGNFASHAVRAIEECGSPVQTCRLATAPFAGWAPSNHPNQMIELACRLETLARQHGFNYLSLGPALPDSPGSFQIVPAVLAATENVFLTGIMTTAHRQVSLPAVQACGKIISQVSSLRADGFTNLRFSALANVPPGGPFLPAAYHATGAPPSFALGVECADTILEVFSQAPTLAEARTNLLAVLEDTAKRIATALEPLAVEYGLVFNGFDFSTAPYPQDWCSVGAALEKLGVSTLGLQGSLAAAAFLADTLDRGAWKRAGFNGLMLPVLEDSYLASRSAQGTLTVKDLLLYSTVCGTGLDTVPLPGDSTPEQISALLLDVAALSLRLNKPLTARLMPMPGKKAGDSIEFDFEFFANGRVMALEAHALAGLLSGQEALEINSRGL